MTQTLVFWQHKKTQAFTIIELLVTLSIIGLLLVAILPALGRYGRNADVGLAAQTVREALAEIHTDAISPNPTNCPEPSGSPAINRYVFFAGGKTPIGPGQSTYICNSLVYPNPVVLQNNEYALLAENVTIDNTGVVTNTEPLGIIRVASIDAPTIFSSPFTSGSSKSTLIGYDSPSGQFAVDQTLRGTTPMYNYLSTPANGEAYGPISNFTPAAVNSPTDPTGEYVLIGLVSPENYHITLFINTVTGQVSSTGAAPAGYSNATP